VRITDFKSRSFSDIDLSDDESDVMTFYKSKYGNDMFTKTDAEMILVRPKMMAMMSSAILCTKPGAESGELLMAYPQTGISTSQTTETMKMQLRVYLGAAVYTPENYVIIPDIQFEGLVGGHGANICTSDVFDPEYDDLIVAFKKKGSRVEHLIHDEYFRQTAGNLYYANYYDAMDSGDSETMSESLGRVTGEGFNTEDGVPLRFHQGATWKEVAGEGWVQQTINSGHLGGLDNPLQCDRLDGIQRFMPVEGL
jgi:hypothetical protein